MESKLKVEYLKIDAIKPYEKNTRKHEDFDIGQIAESIREFGFNDPIGIWSKDNIIVEGHGRLEAAKRLGFETVPCVRLDHLSDKERKAYAIMHNKTAENSDYAWENLKEELASLDLSNFAIDWEFDIAEDVKPEKEKPEVEFAKVLNEEHNYIVLYFDNSVDWLQAETLFDLQKVKCGSTRIDGYLSKGMTKTGLGRVINGAKAINMLLEAGRNEDIG